MKYEIFIDKPARKFIEKQPKPQRLRLYAAIMRLPEGDVKPLKGTDKKNVCAWAITGSSMSSTKRHIESSSYPLITGETYIRHTDDKPP